MVRRFWSLMLLMTAVLLVGSTQAAAQDSAASTVELRFPADQQMPNARGAGCLQSLIGTGAGLFDADGQCVAISSACHQRAQDHDAGCTIWTVHDEKTTILKRFECYPLEIVSTSRGSDETWSTWRGEGRLCLEPDRDGAGFFEGVACEAAARDGVEYACVAAAVPFIVMGAVDALVSSSETRATSGGPYYTGYVTISDD